MSELKVYVKPIKTNMFGKTIVGQSYYLKSDADKVIAEKDAEIEELKCKCLNVKDAAHVLKAFKFYLCQLTHCAHDELTAQWILDNWEQDYDRVEAYNGIG